MIARFALLQPPLRGAIAAGLVVGLAGGLIALAAVLTLALVHRQEARSELAAETARLHAALQDRLDAAGPPGPGPFAGVAAADADLASLASGIADLRSDRLDVASETPVEAGIGAVRERHMVVTLSGPPDAMSEALAAAAELDARVFGLDVTSPAENRVRARIVFTAVLAEDAQ
ncbi:MAG: hypothetical protein ACFE0P_03210 [Oceanicaulis sp.]